MSVSIAELEKATKSLVTANALLIGSIQHEPKNIDLHKALRDSCIQRFEYCVELSWKTSIRYLGLETKAPNPAIREMAQNGLIDNPKKWLNFIIARNKTSHAYEEKMAESVYQQVNLILPELQKLIQRLNEPK